MSLSRVISPSTIITNSIPRWASDYPPCGRLKILIGGTNKKPQELDIIITDSKFNEGKAALRFKQANLHIPFFCMSFETPNWVAEYDKEYARKLQAPKDVISKADILLANSKLSAKYLLKWLGSPRTPAHVLQPAVNTHALEEAEKLPIRDLGRPYAVWSARAPSYKGGHVAISAIFNLDIPFDLVAFGELKRKVPVSPIHRLHTYKDGSDVQKFSLMRGAHMVLAPSKFEGFGMVPGEALASGTSVVVYDLPVLRQEYGDRKGMIYVPWADEKAFRETVRRVANNKKIKLDNRSIAATKKKYGMSKISKRSELLPYHAMQRKSITAHMISYWGFVPESLESVYKHVDQIVIAYGRVGKADPIDDGSLERLRAFPDPDNKITLKVRNSWKDKTEMRAWCASKAVGNYMLLLDGDEIWTGLDKWIADGVAWGCPRWVNFWHDGSHWVYDTAQMGGRRWGKKMSPYGSTCPHYRWSWWRSSYRYTWHTRPIDIEDNLLHSSRKKPAKDHPETVIYHLGHALPKEVMELKHEFYLKRDGVDSGRKNRKTIWHNWSGQTGDIGDGIVERVDWKLPKIVRKGLKSVQGFKK